MGSDDEELARTATAPVSSPASPAVPISSTLGRYRIERELGAGGMGVVHAAFDPDLERRVALKVLRSADGGEARQRLLREARAMARLAHPNVVTVHEVGSASGRDFVAMELVEGTNLADWLRAAQQPQDAIIAAFVAAARGLAAAHAAGIVHRDFKPHNVLRDGNGRIVVTDFGLARDTQEAAPTISGATIASRSPRAKAALGASGTPLSGLTATGSVLGTPAYMAPEQWASAAVTPASDQFAFCVALWEALAGERPFRGDSVEALKEEVARGPAALDASRIPRRLRGVLRRGLDPDPKARWASMEAVVTAMTTSRRPRVAIAVGVSAVVIAGVAIAGVTRDSGGDPRGVAAPLPSCPAPAVNPNAIKVRMPDEYRSNARAREAAAIHDDVLVWKRARDAACGMDPVTAAPLLRCLDGVMVRLDAVATVVASLELDDRSYPRNVDVGDLLIDPAVCAPGKKLPELATTASPALREVIATIVRVQAHRDYTKYPPLKALAAYAEADPCAAALANVLAADRATPTDRDRHVSVAEQEAQRCDDRVRAETAIAVARFALASGFLGTTISAKIQQATTAVARVSQPDLLAEIELLRLETAVRADNIDDAITRGDAAMAGFAARKRYAAQVGAGLTALELREQRANPDDVARARTMLGELRAFADRTLDDHPVERRVQAEIAMRVFLAGEVEPATNTLNLLQRRDLLSPQRAPRLIEGRVVDIKGKPVDHAMVAVGIGLTGNAVTAAMATPWQAPAMRFDWTDEHGRFSIRDAPTDGIVIAESRESDLRSLPMAIRDGEVTLVAEPTTRIAGKVDLRGEPPTRVIVAVQDLRSPLGTNYEMLAPVAHDGRFTLTGVPRSRLRVVAALRLASSRSIAAVTIDTSAGPVADVKLAVANKRRVVHVIVRSTVGVPVANAQVLVFPGALKSTTADKIDMTRDTAAIQLARQIEGEKAPPSVVANARPGDIFATMTQVPDGLATACAIGLPNDLSDAGLDAKISDHLSKIEVRCAPIAPAADTVVVEVPPWPRLD